MTAEVYVAAAPGEEEHAQGLANALTILGFPAASGAPAEGELAKTVDDAKCVVALWSRAAPAAPWLAALAVLAQERKKLVSAERQKDATPEPFRAGPRIDLAIRDRAAFKERFQALVTELDKLTTAKADLKALPEALAKARGALLKPIVPKPGRTARMLGMMAVGVALLFAVGFGAGRVINAVRSGTFMVATPQADAATTEAATTSAATAPLSLDTLGRARWQDVAAQINAANADGIKQRAAQGDATAQTFACLGHMSGAEGFLPSPTAAREQCDLAAAQHLPAALYLSWVLRREAPHAGLDETTARARLQEAATLNWVPAQIDYAQVLANNGAHAEAGRLFLAAAESGDPRGQFFYARWLRDSPAGPQDPTAAVPFLERASSAGQVDAQHMLATLYRDGVGVPRNEARAEALYEQAARQNHTPSMFNLADMLRGGTPEQRARAVTLYQQLACMPDERQIQPMAAARLRALHETYACR